MQISCNNRVLNVQNWLTVITYFLPKQLTYVVATLQKVCLSQVDNTYLQSITKSSLISAHNFDFSLSYVA